MAFDDYFLKQIAVDPSTGTIIAGAQFQVYATSDVGFTTPLVITDLGGVPLPFLESGPTGITSEFKCPGYRQVVARSVDGLLTPLYSLGIAFEMMPDPTGQPDGQAIVTSAGEFILAPLPGAGIGTRVENVFTTGALAAAARELGLVALGKTVLILRVEVDTYSRVRAYDTTAHQTADASRALGVDPDPLVNTGVLLDMELEPGEAWTLTPPAPVGSFTGNTTVPITVDNLDDSTAVVNVTFTFVILEG